MDFDLVSKWVGFLALVISVISGWLGLVTRSTKAYDDQLTKHDGDLIKHDQRIQHMEDQLRHMPTKDEFHDLAVEIERMRGEIKLIASGVASTRAIVERVERYVEKLEGK